jgi:6-phospho-beta-glucosidase
MKITLLGTGVRTPFVLHGLAAKGSELGLTEVTLHDLDPGRLDVMQALGSHLCRQWGAQFDLRAERDPRRALSEARFVFSAIRSGQDRARALDEEIPLKYGILGQETTGPAGFAMAMRTIPEVLALARLIEEVCPAALVVNFTNPVGIIMQALTDHTAIRAVGVCDGPIEMKRSVAEFLDVSPDEIHVDYFGLNHCGWIHRVLVDGRNRLPEVLDRYEQLRRVDESWRLFDTELVQSIGMLPMEYLYFYYYRDRAVNHILQSGSTRGAQIEALNDALWPALHNRISAGDLDGAWRAWERVLEARGASYFSRERGETVDPEDDAVANNPPGEMFEGDGYEGLAIAVMTAAVQRRKVPLIVNVRNMGAIGGLRDGDVVEVTCQVDEHGPHPLAQGSIPPTARALIEPVKEYERLTVQAAVEGSYSKALQALLTHPLVGSYPTAKSLLDDYLAVHPGFLQPAEQAAAEKLARPATSL